MSVTTGFRYLLNLLFPPLCRCCGNHLTDGEDILCLHCLLDLPYTQFSEFYTNKAAQRFWGKVPLEKVTAGFYFEKGTHIQLLLHRLKYNNEKIIGYFLGQYVADRWLSTDFFKGIDLLIPVPLHPKKLRKRGYNQSEWIARGVAQLTGIECDTSHLHRTTDNVTQTHLSAYERYLNTQNIFTIKHPDELIDKHILLIDDVLTTGATLETCARILLTIPHVKVSVLALCIAND